MAGYSPQGAGLLVALVALQQIWGVDFDSAVARADQAIEQYLMRFGSNPPRELGDVVALMRGVAPPPAPNPPPA